MFSESTTPPVSLGFFERELQTVRTPRYKIRRTSDITPTSWTQLKSVEPFCGFVQMPATTHVLPELAPYVMQCHIVFSVD